MKNRSLLSKINEPEFFASRPLKKILFLRKFIPWQLVKFFIINYKIMRIVVYGHS